MRKNKIIFSNILKKHSYKEIGLYIPLRAYPYIHLIPKNINIRLFNDDPSWHRNYLDGFKNPIENLSDLLAYPPDLLIICSLSFGKEIYQKIPNNVLPTSKIILWSDIFKE